MGTTTSVVSRRRLLFWGALTALGVGFPRLASPRAILRSTRSGVPTYRWSDVATWGGSLPTSGTDVVVSAGTIVILDLPNAAARSVTINGSGASAGQLIADTTIDIGLTTEWVNVAAGTWKIGNSADDPYTHIANIYLTGAYVTPTSDGVQNIRADGGLNRGIVVDGGTLKFYGVIVTNPFLPVGATISTAATTATISATHGWATGSEVAFGTTNFPQNANPEKRTLTSASGASIGWAGTLADARYGSIIYKTDAGLSTSPGTTTIGVAVATASTPTSVDARAIAANLTRNIVVHGGASAADGDWVTYKHGAHMMFMGLCTVQLQSVEVRRGGQAGILGRYPIHWHANSYNTTTKAFIADLTANWAKYCSINESFNRAYTLHAVCGVTLTYNAAYDVRGWSYFQEDGSEERNVLQFNLAMYTQNPATTRYDASAPHTPTIKVFDGNSSPTGNLSGSGGFWSTNPTNLVEDNVVVWAQGRGMQNAFPSQTWGLTTGALDAGSNIIKPYYRPHAGFNRNKIFSARAWGLFLGEAQSDEAGNMSGPSDATFPGKYNPYVNGIGTGTRSRPTFDSNQIFYCRLGGYRNQAVMIDYTRFTTMDCGDRHFSGIVTNGSNQHALGIKNGLHSVTNTGISTPVIFTASYHSTFLSKNNTAHGFVLSGPAYPGPIATEDYGGFMATSDFYLQLGIHNLLPHSGNLLTGSSVFAGWSRSPTEDGQAEFTQNDKSISSMPIGVTVNCTAHGKTANTQVMLTVTSGSLPPEIIERAIYFVRNPTTNALELSATSGGASINFTVDGTGTTVLHEARYGRHFTINGALIDANGIAGTAGNYLVHNKPFYTIGLSASSATTDGATGRRSTPDRHYGVGYFYNDVENALNQIDVIKLAILVDQCDSAGAAIATARHNVYLGQGNQALYNMRTWCARKGGIYRLSYPNQALPTVFSRATVSAGALATDYFAVTIPWGGTATPKVHITNSTIQASTYNIPTSNQLNVDLTAKLLTNKVASLAAFLADATFTAYFVDTDSVWVWASPPTNSVTITPEDYNTGLDSGVRDAYCIVVSV